jgi:hypothetical protein
MKIMEIKVVLNDYWGIQNKKSFALTLRFGFNKKKLYLDNNFIR